MRRATKSAKRGKRKKAWRSLRLRRTTERRTESSLKCVGLPHDRVRRFFVQHHCRSLRRQIFGLADPEGDLVVVSVVRVRMRSRHQRNELKNLIDVYGTGDVYPLASNLLGLDGVHFTGKHYSSRSGGRSLVAAETEPLNAGIGDAYLDGIAQVATYFP